MKAISLWQPWATLIASGAKKIETRGWATSHRGRIAIHAAKRKVIKELKELAEWEEYRAALGVPVKADESEEEEEKAALQKMLELPYGAIVAIATLKECRNVADFSRLELFTDRGGWDESDLGNYASGRLGWVLTDVCPIEPVPYKGEQGLFDIPNELLRSMISTN